MISLTSKVTGDDAVLQRLREAPTRIKAMVRRAIDAGAISVQEGAKAKLSDQVLHVRTGRLRRSINVKSFGDDTNPRASIGTNVEYAAINEFGGQTKAHIIEAVNGNALMFMGAGGKPVFRALVRHPGSTIPERSFLRSALTDRADAIRQRISDAIGEARP